MAGVTLMALGWFWWRACPRTPCPHTTCHNLSTHTQLTHTHLVTTQLTHIHLVDTQLVHTQVTHTHTHTSLRHTFVAHADPSPSLFSFLHFPSHLYLSFAAYWKKLTCGVIRSLNCCCCCGGDCVCSLTRSRLRSRGRRIPCHQ